jgi:hypothetical protein
MVKNGKVMIIDAKGGSATMTIVRRSIERSDSHRKFGPLAGELMRPKSLVLDCRITPAPSKVTHHAIAKFGTRVGLPAAPRIEAAPQRLVVIFGGTTIAETLAAIEH